jgi:hypothetical protein
MKLDRNSRRESANSRDIWRRGLGPPPPIRGKLDTLGLHFVNRRLQGTAFYRPAQRLMSTKIPDA